MAERRKRPPGEALVDLRRRLSLLSPRDPGRTEIVARAADAYGISIWTLYRKRRAQTVQALKFQGMRASIWLIGQPCASRSSVSASQA